MDIPTPLAFHYGARLAETILISMSDHPTKRVQGRYYILVGALKVVSQQYFVQVTHRMLFSGENRSDDVLFCARAHINIRKKNANTVDGLSLEVSLENPFDAPREILFGDSQVLGDLSDNPVK